MHKDTNGLQKQGSASHDKPDQDGGRERGGGIARMTLVKKEGDLEYHVELILSGNKPVGAIVVRKEYFQERPGKKREEIGEMTWVLK